MTQQLDRGLPAKLIAAVEGRNLLVVCGAGISMAPPSNLPSWWGFNSALFDSLRKQAAEIVPDLAPLLDSLSLEGRLPVTAVSDLVVRTFAGGGYFPLLTALEGARPNANHVALAILALRGIVADIVTFNFDTLIEQAFRTTKVPLRVLVRPEDYDRLDLRAGACSLHKVHGSVTDAAALVDTVSQKLRGLAPATRSRLHDLFEHRHVLFVGFSGADFDFGSEYLPMTANAQGGHGFTWLHRGSVPAVAARLYNPAGVFIEGFLPEFFTRLGIEISAPEPAGPPTDIRTQVDAWTKRRAVGPWSSAALIQAFAAAVQDHILQTSLDKALAQRVTEELRNGNAQLAIGTVTRRLALHALQQNDAASALRWSAQELAIHETTMDLLTDKRTQKARPEVQLEYLRNTASVFSNIGLAYAIDPALDVNERRESARTAFLEARTRARGAGDEELQALIQMNLANHVETVPDRKLRALRAAQSAASAAGSGRTLVEATLMECRMLVELSELDLAVEGIKRVRRVFGTADDIALIWEAAVLEAEIFLRRGRADEALGVCEAAAGIGPVGPNTSKSAAARLRLLLSAQQASRDRLIKLLARLGDTDELFLTSGTPLILAETGDEDEDKLRAAVIRAELRSEHQLLAKVFEGIAKLQHRRGVYDRVADTAFALRMAAERAYDQESLMIGHQFLGIAHDLLGNAATAANAFADAVAVAQAAGLPCGQQRSNLAGALWHQGNMAEAERTYRQALDELRAEANWLEFARTTVNFGRALVRAGRADDAIAAVREATAMSEIAADQFLSTELLTLAEFWAAGQMELSKDELNARMNNDPEDLSVTRARAATASQLGNLAIREIDAGDTETALTHIELASRLYRETGDTLGEARCEGNLAQLHSRLEDWEKAIAAQRRSVQLRDQVGNPEETLLAEANLAAILLQAERPEEAVKTARSALQFAEGGSISWAYAQACYVVAMGSLRLGRWSEAGDAILVALAAMKVQTHPQRDQVVVSLEKAAADLDELMAANKAGPPRELQVAAVALLRTVRADPDRRSAAHRLTTASNDPHWTSIEQATFLGEAGNILFGLGERKEAIGAYEASVRAYEQGGHPMAWQARTVLAGRLLDSGEVETAEAAFKEILENCPVAKVRANALVGQAKLIFVHRQEETAMRSLRDQLLAEWSRFGAAPEFATVDPESLGRLGVVLAQAQLWLEEADAARATLHQAKALLVSCNSEILANVKLLEDQMA